MDDYKKYLAEQILSDDKLVTYRALSRALKVHVNVAKQMLYDFHKSQNDRRPGAIHATYLVYGTKKAVEATNGHSHEDGDVEMMSSMPEVESVAEEIITHTLTLVSEEQLQDVLSQYEQVTSIHVYSLGPHPLKDLQLLSDTARPLIGATSTDDSVESGKIYGTISNPYVRRRDRKGTAARPVAQAIGKQQETKPTVSKPAPPTKVKEEPKEAPSKPSTSTAGAAAKKPVPALKRGGSSGIMQAFGKAAAKPKKTPSQPATPVTADEDTSMQAMSDDGEDDSEAVPKPKAEDAGPRQSRKEREEALRRMMDDDEEEEEPEGPEEKADSPMEEPIEEPPAPEAEQEPEPAEVVSSTGDGRRRGKRRIMRKKQIMDEQGYLVTIQEPGWESFSEDETPQPPKKKVETSAPAAQPAKAKKSGPKGAQGNIMSFFSKK